MIEPLRTLIHGQDSDGYCDAGATISADGLYRYRLWREWRQTSTPTKNWDWMKEDDGKTIVKDGAGKPVGSPKSVLWVMLNPSTADGKKDDPTIRKCVKFSKTWGYDRMEVVNLFAYRATKPNVILSMGGREGFDPVGDRNQMNVERAVSIAGLIILAWGTNGSHLGQDQTMLGWLDQKIKLCRVLAVTKDGHPKHPLYCLDSTVPQMPPARLR